MSVQVKICGLKTRATLDAALDAGADYFGMVFFPKSPRNVDIETAVELANHARGRARSVSLLVDPDDSELDAIVTSVNPDYVQLHGSETPERVAEIRQRSGKPVIKAVKVSTTEDVQASRAYDDVAELILYDAKAPENDPSALPGGNGVPFDWQALMGVKGRSDFMLSGGLDADNVSEAIRATGAGLVDVSSGVENAPGHKDPDKIRRFIEAAKSTPRN